MNKQATLCIVVVALMVPAAYSLFFSRSAVEKLDNDIRKELSRGSTKQQVYDFLDARKIPSSGYDAGPDPMIGLPERDRQWRRYVTAWIPKSDSRIMIYFYFDEKQNLDNFALEKLDDVP